METIAKGSRKCRDPSLSGYLNRDATTARKGGDGGGDVKFDTGDTAWVLISTALVMFMTPGLALFYGGMVRAKNVLGMLMQNFFALGIVSVIWAVVGYSPGVRRHRRR